MAHSAAASSCDDGAGVLAARRMLVVHAHPDDESITTGATMARYAAQGTQVVLLTCTLGEEGEILVPELASLAADQADQLGGYRIAELAAACAALGVRDRHFLGGAGTYRDSGMTGSAANEHPRAFWRASTDTAVFDAAVAQAAEVIRHTRPQVLVTYDDDGDYGHPDHVMAHRVATAAVERAAGPQDGAAAPWQVAKLYWTATPTSSLRRGFEAIAAAGVGFTTADVGQLAFGVPDEVITTSIDVAPHVDAKLAALRAHRTQIVVDGAYFALSNMLGRLVEPVEHFRLAQGELGPDRDDDGRETDLFSGVDVDRAHP